MYSLRVCVCVRMSSFQINYNLPSWKIFWVGWGEAVTVLCIYAHCYVKVKVKVVWRNTNDTTVVGVHHVLCDGGSVSHRWHCCSSSCTKHVLYGRSRCSCCKYYRCVAGKLNQSDQNADVHLHVLCIFSDIWLVVSRSSRIYLVQKFQFWLSLFFQYPQRWAVN